jgi:hypothetical protein
MRTLSLLTCASLAVLVSACAETPGGYYDDKGNFVRTAGNSAPFEHNVTLRDKARLENRAHAYERRGYYDYYGNYMEHDEDGLNVPTSMFPPRGMCRVWFTDGRGLRDQPPVQACSQIRSRVPAGAYVIYGG